MLYSVLIVDDDKRVRVGLINNINWNALGFDTPMQADSFASAMACFSVQRIDILITDIRMPGSSGLELCQKVSSHYPKTTILILSGYSDFEYAQQAIQFGVKYYLTKPTDLVQFRDVLTDIRSCLDSERKALKRVSEMEKRYNQTVHMLLEQFCADISYGAIRNDNTLKIFLEENHIVFPYAFYCVASCEPRPETVNNKYDCSHILVLLENFIKMHFKDYEICFYTYRMNKYSINILFNYSDPDSLHHAVDHLYSNCVHMLNLEISIAVSNASTNLEGVAACYNQVRELSAYNGHSGVLHYAAQDLLHNSRSLFWDPSYIKEAENQLLSYISSCDENKASSLINLLFSRFSPGIAQFDYCRELFVRLLFAVEHHISSFHLQIQDILGESFSIFKKAQELHDTQEMSDGLKHCIHLVISSLKQSKTSFSYKLVERIKLYIESNYTDDISLYSAAENVHMSPSYISKIFKKNTGCNFVEYLTTVRINQSKLLLADMNIKIYEVATMVGYKSTKHFSQVFKAQVGMTPFDYKKSIC